jgi:hypothetical protein
MEQSPSWEANWFAASQEIPRIFYGTRRFVTALTSVRHLSLSWASPSEPTYPHPTSWRSILILFTHLHLGLPRGLFPSGFPFKLFTMVFLVMQNRNLQSFRQIQLWDAFGSREKRLLPSSLPSVQWSVRMYRHGPHSMNWNEIRHWGLSWKHVEIIHIWLK